MEKDKNPLPQIDLFPRVTRVVRLLFNHLQHEGLSDHARGGGPMLDRVLYEQQELPYGADEQAL